MSASAKSEILSTQSKILKAKSKILKEMSEISKRTRKLEEITAELEELKLANAKIKIFDGKSSQEEIFEKLTNMFQYVVDGHNVCIFAEPGSERGIILRSVEQIFKIIAELQKSGWSYTVKASFLEIIQNEIRDLLSINNEEKHEIIFIGQETTVTNLAIKEIESAEKLERYMVRAQKNKAAATSHQSHIITKIYLEGTLEEHLVKGSLNLVDLAGPEYETKSLAVLGDVIEKININESDDIPYRNSPLTSYLQSSLGGGSRFSFITH